jgi:hypothetical protein
LLSKSKIFNECFTISGQKNKDWGHPGFGHAEQRRQQFSQLLSFLFKASFPYILQNIFGEAPKNGEATGNRGTGKRACNT